MTPLSQCREGNTDYAFVARLDNVKNVAQILKAVNFKDSATFYCTENGLKVTVEDLKCVQASAFIQSDVFQAYELKKADDDILAFKINLSVVLECLNIFGNCNTNSVPTALKLCYLGYGFPLKLLLEEDGVITDCSIKTQSSDEVLDFNFDHSTDLNKVILRCDYFREVMNDLDTSSDYIEIIMSPDPPYFRFTTVGDAGECQIDIPTDSEIIETFQCTKTMKSSYKFSHMKPSMKPLSVGHKASIRMDDRGLLCFQYMVKTEDGHVCFVEYYCTPVIETDDEDR